MKKLILFLLLITNSCFAFEYGYYCSDNIPSKTASGVIMSSSGVNFAARQIAQAEIKKALKKETNSKFKVKLNSFWGTNIAQGEFNKLKAVSKNYFDDKYSVEKLTVETLCPYNKVSYKDDSAYKSF